MCYKITCKSWRFMHVQSSNNTNMCLLPFTYFIHTHTSWSLFHTQNHNTSKYNKFIKINNNYTNKYYDNTPLYILTIKYYSSYQFLVIILTCCPFSQLDRYFIVCIMCVFIREVCVCVHILVKIHILFVYVL